MSTNLSAYLHLLTCADSIQRNGYISTWFTRDDQFLYITCSFTRNSMLRDSHFLEKKFNIKHLFELECPLGTLLFSLAHKPEFHFILYFNDINFDVKCPCQLVYIYELLCYFCHFLFVYIDIVKCMMLQWTLDNPTPSVPANKVLD